MAATISQEDTIVAEEPTPNHVYEFDTEAVLAGLSGALQSRGFEVIEGMPAGVWWLHSVEERDVAFAALAAALEEVVAANFREVPEED